MNVVALIARVSAVGGFLLLAARLTGYASGFQGAAAVRMPVPVIFAGPAAAAGSATARCGTGTMT